MPLQASLSGGTGASVGNVHDVSQKTWLVVISGCNTLSGLCRVAGLAERSQNSEAFQWVTPGSVRKETHWCWRFGISRDKRLAVIPDARLGPKTDAYAAFEHLLSISGGDPQSINRKYGTFWNGYLAARFLITTNVLPALADDSGTLASRFVLLGLTKRFLGKEDRKLKRKLKPELAGILNMALDGLDRLRERGHFVMPEMAGGGPDCRHNCGAVSRETKSPDTLRDGWKSTAVSSILPFRGDTSSVSAGTDA